MLVPMRISVRTTVGTNIIEATRWVRGAATAEAPATTGSLASR
jgi:hypothetical protein